MEKDNIAILSSVPEYTLFYFNGMRLKFLCPYSLEKYTEVKSWKDGFLVVMAKYSDEIEPEEEYIDLRPILKNLLIDKEKFLSNIKEVKISYDSGNEYGSYS